MGDLFIETKNISTSDVISGTNSEISDLQQLKVGAGSSIFFTDKEGSRWGHHTFDSAKAWIKVDGTAKFMSSNGDVLLSTGATDGNFINIINTALNTSSKTILQGFTFGSSDYAGSFKTGNITWNEATGAITGGSGSVYNKAGLIFANNGVPTITLNGVTGAATFAGTLAAASGTFAGTLVAASGTFAGTLSATSGTLGTITAGTITGCTIQSTSGTNRIQMTTGDLLEFYYSNVRQGYIRADGSGDLHLVGTDDVIFNAGSGDRCGVFGSTFRPMSDGDYNLGSDPGGGGKGWNEVYGRRFYAGSSGTGGVTVSNYGFLTALRISGSPGKVNMDGKYREISVIGGIVTKVSGETDWVFLDSASNI